MRSKARSSFLIIVLVFSCLVSIWAGFDISLGEIPSKFTRLFGNDPQNSEPDSSRNRRSDRATEKRIKDLSTLELDRYLDARGINDASVLFVLLHSGDAKYRDLAGALPDSPLKFMMLSMDIHDDPAMRLEWTKKLYELDPLNTVSVLRYVSQLMDSGDKEQAAEVLNTVRNCDHNSNGYDQLIQEFEFARDLFGGARFGPLAERTARIWPVRTGHYTVENYLDSLDYPAASGEADMTVIHDKARNYLLDIGYFEDEAEMTALIQTRMFLAGIRGESTDPNLKDRISKEIAGIQARTDALFNAGLEDYEKSGRHRSAAEDMDYVIEHMSKWKTRKTTRE